MMTRIIGAILVVAVLSLLYVATQGGGADNTSQHDTPQSSDDGALRGLKIN
jgi:hypothetical protein